MPGADPQNEVKERIFREIEKGASLRIAGSALSGKTSMLQELASQPGVIHLDANLMSAQRTGSQPAWTLLPNRGFHAPGPFNLDAEDRALLRAARLLIIDNCGQLRIDTFQQLRDALFMTSTGYGPFAGRQIVLGYDPAGIPAPLTPQAEAFAQRHYGSDARIESSRYFHDLPVFDLGTPSATLEHASHQEAAPSDCRDLPDGAVLVTGDAAAARWNDEAMSELPGGVYRLPATLHGAFEGPRPTMPMEGAFKRGARVLITSADPEGAWQAGDTGILLSCERDRAGSPVAIIGHHDGREIRVGPMAIQSVRHGTARTPGAGASVTRTAGGILLQVPIVPGWAISARALNGISLAAPVIDVAEIGDAALVGAAMSRARSAGAVSVLDRREALSPVPAE